MILAILSDIHEDFESLQQALKKIRKKNCDKIVCLGDISGFSVPHYRHFKARDAHKCLELIRDNCEIVIIGNHDLNASKQIPIINPDFDYPDNWFELDFIQKKAVSNDLVWLYDDDELNPLYTIEDIEFQKALPEYAIIEQDGYNILLSHYIFPNLTGSTKEFFNDSYKLDQHFLFMEKNNCHLSFCGHSHIPKGQVVFRNPSFSRINQLVSNNSKACVICPPIVQSERSGRFTIFDTEIMKLEFLKI